MNYIFGYSDSRTPKVKLIRQAEVAECGLACLAMVANCYGANVDLTALRIRFKPSARGSSLKSLIMIADKMRMIARAVKAPIQRVGSLSLPCILHWSGNHYVVLEKVRNGTALIHNPVGQSKWMRIEEISDFFDGVAIEVRPSSDFLPINARSNLKLSQLCGKIFGFKTSILHIVLLSIVMQVYALASPYYMQIAMDDVIPSLEIDFLTILAIGFALFCFVNATATLMRSLIMTSSGSSIGFAIASNVGRRLFRLPISWFGKRHVGDILSRFQSVIPIRQFMTQGAPGVLIDGTLALLILCIMAFYSLSLTALALLAFSVYACIRIVTFSAQRHAQEDLIVSTGREQTNLIETLRGIVTLRLFNREAVRHSIWQSRLADSTNANARLSQIGSLQTTLNSLVFGLENIISIWLSVKLLIGGGFSIGMIFAFMAYKQQFIQRSASLIDQATMFKMLGLHLERISDIALASEDRSFEGDREAVGGMLNGRLELRNVSFRYSPTDPLILDDVNLVIEKGSNIAITGPSGGGKSTLAKIILGLIEPDSGEVLIDNIAIRKFGYSNYHEQIAAVLQDDSLFAGTVIDNIAFFDELPDFTGIVAAAKSAAIHDDIESMPMGYETLIGDMGSSLSGGQRQRLLIARALYRDPKLLLIDEGTSHLDPSRERAVNDAVADLGITRIVIAHRRETLRAAPVVYSLRAGKLEDITGRFGGAQH